MAIHLHDSITLPCNADSAEWCPWRGFYSDILAVGMYQLQEDGETRHGVVQLYSLQKHDTDVGADSPLSVTMRPQLGCELPGVFDLKWSPWGPVDGLLGAVLADGTLRTYSLVAGRCEEKQAAPILGDSQPPSPSERSRERPAGLSEVGRCHACSSGMALSLDWRTLGCDDSDSAGVKLTVAEAVVSSSSGSLSIVKVERGGRGGDLLASWPLSSA